MQNSRASFFINLTPVFAVILAYLLLDEQLGWSEVAGGSVILLGVFIAQSRAATELADPEMPKGV